MKHKLPFTVLLAVANALLLCDPGYTQDGDTSNDQPNARGPQQVGYPAGANVANIKDFGAVGDGQTDDTAVILRALRLYNRSSPGTLGPLNTRTIYFPPGTYLVSDTLYPEDKDYPGTATSSVRLLGAGVDRTIIKLRDNTPSFGKGAEKYLLQTGNARKGDGAIGKPNAGYGNYIQHLTINTGKRNPGAIGVRFDVANMGAMQDVRILSGDGGGKFGLFFDSIAGTGYVNRVEIDGFSTGLRFEGAAVNNIVFDDLTIANAKGAAIDVGGKNIQIRKLTTINSPTPIRSTIPYSAIVLVGAHFYGSPATPLGAAINIDQQSFFFGRDLVASPEFGSMIKYPGKTVVGARIDSGKVRVEEWSSHSARRGHKTVEYASSGKQVQSMNLPILDSPEIPIEEIPAYGAWRNVRDFGAAGDGLTDDTAAFQAAIDSIGSKIVYAPYGRYRIDGRVFLRNGVRRVDFLFSKINGAGHILVNNYWEGVRFKHVSLENLVTSSVTVTHNSNMTVVLKNVQAPLIDVGPSATGKFFIENAGPRTVVEIDRVQTWIRQLNREIVGAKNRGGTVWLLGDNIEGKGFKQGNYPHMKSFATVNGGRTEVLGGAIDTLRYHGEGRAVEPIYAAVTVPSDAVPSRLSVVSASLAVQAVDSTTGEPVWNRIVDPNWIPIKGVKPPTIYKIVFGSWDVLLLDHVKPSYSVYLPDTYGVKVPVNEKQERMFMPLYNSVAE